MFLKSAKIVEVLELAVYSIEVNFRIFMNKNIAQPGHRQDAIGKILRDDFVCGNNFNRLLVITRPSPVVGGNYVVADIKECLYANL